MDINFDKFLNIASGVFDTTKKKVTEEAKIISLSYDKGTAENDLEAAYADLGRIAYNKIKVGIDIGSEATEFVDEIDNIKKEIEELKKNIEEHKEERDTAEYKFASSEDDIEIVVDEEEK